MPMITMNTVVKETRTTLSLSRKKGITTLCTRRVRSGITISVTNRSRHHFFPVPLKDPPFRWGNSRIPAPAQHRGALSSIEVGHLTHQGGDVVIAAALIGHVDQRPQS